MRNTRRLFDELVAGVKAMREHREGKVTLRTHEVRKAPPLEMDAKATRDTERR